MQLGIIGLPTSGKTTIFNALTGSDRPTHAAASGRIEVHRAVVAVPDQRIDRIADLLKTPNRIAAQVTYVDIGGLGGSERGTGLSGKLRNHLEKLDGFLHVIRAFDDPAVPHPLTDIDPQRDLETLDVEFVLADLALIENRLTRIADEMRKGKADKGDRATLAREQDLLERLQTALEEGALLRDLQLETSELDLLRGYGLLTRKPVIVVLNLSADQPDVPVSIQYDHTQSRLLSMRGQLEMEISQLDESDAQLFMAEYGIEEAARQRVIRESYALLGLHTFFTSNEKEVRAWPLRINATALEAAAAIHTDMARGFIRAEVAHFEDLMSSSGWADLRSAGKLHIEGRDYIVQDGDQIMVRFNV